jgi:hypothetical protein
MSDALGGFCAVSLIAGAYRASLPAHYFLSGFAQESALFYSAMHDGNRRRQGYILYTL